MSAVSIKQNDAESRESAAVSDQSESLSFPGYLARTLPTTVLAMFALIAGSMYLYRGDLAGSIGVGLFMAFWLGGGFGFLIGGVLYAVANEESHD